MATSDFSQWFAASEEAIKADFFKFLSFKSISSEPEFAGDLKACCDWLKSYMEQLGLSCEVWKGEGHPTIFGQKRSSNPEAPTLLIYHHYDVQPADPYELWDSPPFEPTEKEGVIYARGACDNKGQCFYSLMAIKAFLESHASLKFNLKVIVEGEEEIGSPSLPKRLEKYKEKIEADHLLVVDVDMPGENIPGITLGVRGIITFDLTLTGANQDLHSGNHGGLALNPNKALAQLLSCIWNESGSIAIPHFYDDLKVLDKRALKELYLDFDEEEYQKEFGVRALDSEGDFSPIVCNWLRPTFEINGMSGGYSGEGFKTIIPAVAKAKLSCRLPPDLDPDKVAAQVMEFLHKKCRPGMDLEIVSHGGGRGVRTEPTAPIAQIASKAFETVYGAPCRSSLTGGSIPVTEDIVKESGANVVFIGTGLMGDGIHSPNEHFAWKRFKEGFLVMTEIFNALNGG